MDIKDRMAAVHDTGQTEVQDVAETLDAKINAMTVDMAKIQHQLETTLKNLESEMTRLAAAKAEKSEVRADVDRLEKVLSDRESAAAKTLENELKKALTATESRAAEQLARSTEMEQRLGQKTAEMEKQLGQKTAEMEAVIQKMMAEVKAEKAESATLAARLATREEAMAALQKELSLVKIKADTLEQTTIDRKTLDRELARIKQQFPEKSVPSQPGAASGNSVPRKLPKTSENISEKDLLQ
jgi:septal ring factor EnvC (AmiA/AmiB activator)